LYRRGDGNMTAINLNIGASAIIKGFENSVIAGRFLELGITPGCKIRIIRQALFKGAHYIEINGNEYALRPSELSSILLQDR
jgi:Fe2+ transport system protein FeoA